MKSRVLNDRFGLMLMEGEELILEAGPADGFITLFVIATCMTVVGIAVAPIAYVCARIAKDKFRYWLTNRRIILSSGFIGYRIRSIPLERVSDVALSNTLLEMLAGIKSIIVRDMTGEAQTGKSLLAIENASEVQKAILDEVQKVNSQSRAL